MKSISSLFILVVYQLLLFTPHFTFAAPTQDRQELIDIFNQALADSRYNLTEGDVGEAATRLFGWEGCSASMKRDIYSGWQDSWKMMDAVKNINWNEAAAVDYLSPPFMHDDNQEAMQDIISTVSTIRGGSSLNPFKWWLHVRCDDPNNRCPCGSRTSTVAYTTQKDPESGYARINFCPRYFELPNLDAAVKENSRRDLPIAHRADLDNYVKNKGRTWYHELLHIDWASGVRSIWHIRDIAAFYKDEDNVYYRTVVYDAERTKALAHYKFDPATFVRRNADNFAMYAMAKYVQKVVGKYPHLPLAMTFDDVEDGPGLFMSGGIIIDLQGKVTMAGATEDDSCHVPEIQDIPEEDVVPFNSSTWFWKTSDYPEDYQRQYRGWFADAYPYQNRVHIVFMYSALGPQWMTYADTPDEPITDFCSAKVLSNTLAEGDENDWKFPTKLPAFDAHSAKGCVYSGTTDLVGEMICESGASNIRCWEDPESREISECEGGRYMLGIKCDWQ